MISSDDHRLRIAQYVGLALILILAALLRIRALTRYSLTYDELGSLETAAGRGQVHLTLPRNSLLRPPPVVTSLIGAEPVWKVAVVMQSDVHPPLYFILLRLWQDIFGDSDEAARGLSVVAGVAAVALIFDVGRWWGGTTVGLWAALLMAVAQPQINLSQDARPYALATLLVLAAADALVRIEQLGNNRRRSIALGMSLAAACLTHYFVLPAVLAFGVYALLRLRPRVWLIFAGAAGGVIVLWGYSLWQQRKNFTDPWMYWMNDTDPHHFAATLKRAAGLPLRFLADPIADRATMLASCGAAVLYTLPWLLLRQRRGMILTGLWLIGCAGLAMGLDLLRGTNQLTWVKYTVVGAPAVYLMLPAIGRGWIGHAVAAAAVLFCVMNLRQAYPTDDGVGFKTFAADLDRMATADQTVLICGSGWGEWYSGQLYMGLERYARRMPPQVAVLQAPVPAELLDELAQTARNTGGLWLVTWTNHPPEALLPGWQVEKVVNYVAAVKLYELQPPAP
jgi:dolichyl-phosphate-mannose-protein mannosyltransferase